jgi:hypothetical protein
LAPPLVTRSKTKVSSHSEPETHLTVKTSEGDFTVTFNSDTKIQHPVGLTGMRKKQHTPDVLIPGLKMSFEGAAGSQENQVDAKTITFDSDDLALAEVIQAGLNSYGSTTSPKQRGHFDESGRHRSSCLT